ncbi:unnamed protein product [Aphis gossypii]|uniref:Uncharacterized protein n=1 Tax=Aphis gossypii TaxID=80765 RepID=A0A9P0IPV9_APHGO|nr:unnamed protein product [Aphis gossypii]
MYSGCLVLKRVPGVCARLYIIIIIYLGTHTILKSKTVKKEIHRLSVVVHRTTTAHRKTRILYGYFVSPFVVHGPSAARRPSKISGYSAIPASFEFFPYFCIHFSLLRIRRPSFSCNVVPMDLGARYDCRCAFLSILYLQTSVCFSVFSGHTHHSLYKLLYIIILLCVGSTAPPLVDRGMYMYIIYTRIQLLRAAVNTEVEVFDFDFATAAAAAAGVKTFSSECAGPVSPLCCCNCIGIILYWYDDDHGRVVYTEESSGETNTMLHYACTHTRPYSQIYDTILYWYNMYIYLYLYVWHEIYGAYAK